MVLPHRRKGATLGRGRTPDRAGAQDCPGRPSTACAPGRNLLYSLDPAGRSIRFHKSNGKAVGFCGGRSAAGANSAAGAEPGLDVDDQAGRGAVNSWISGHHPAGDSGAGPASCTSARRASLPRGKRFVSLRSFSRAGRKPSAICGRNESARIFWRCKAAIQAWCCSATWMPAASPPPSSPAW